MPKKKPKKAPLSQRIQIGQFWLRRRDKAVFAVYQVHRPDRLAELRDNGDRITVPFRDLSRYWEQIQGAKR